MNTESLNAAASIAEAWHHDQHFDALPSGTMPVDIAEGYAIQAELAKRIDAPQVGWKIAATNKSGQQHIDVSAPIIGRLFADRVYLNPATLLMRNNQMRVAEAEFTFRFGIELAPGPQRSRDEVMEHVDALFPSIELPDSRFNDFVSAGAAALIADNACAREYILGDEVSGRWRDIALDKFAVYVDLNGEQVVSGHGADVLGDPRDALTWMVNECSRQGITLKRHQYVTTGVIGRPVPIKPGDHIRADFGLLGQVEVTFNNLNEQE
jgi:2-keto-4-pentenoate hydratase